MTLRLVSVSLCAAAVLCGAAPATIVAQSPLVSPRLHTWFTAERATGFPVGLPTRARVRQLEIHDDPALAGARTIQGVAFRRAPGQSQTTTAFVATISMTLSTAPHAAAAIDANFAANHGADAVEVLSARSIGFAATSPPSAGLAPFEFVVPADRPFAFGGLGSLCVDLRIDGHDNPTPILFELASESATPRDAAFGAGCGGLTLRVENLGSGEMRHAVDGSLPGSPVVFAFGLGGDSLGGAAPLPLPLDSIGGLGCSWWIDVAATAVGVADYFGSSRLDVDFSNVAPGESYFAQALSPLAFRGPPPSGTNPRTLLASDALVVAPVGTARRAGRVWSEDLTATSGQAQPVFGLVLQIY